jgi:hypothetical protein
MKNAILESLKEIVRAAGFQVSAGSWEDEFHAYAFSVESHGAATFGHSKFCANYRKESGWLSVTGRPDRQVSL